MYSTRALGIAGTAAAFLALAPALAASAGTTVEVSARVGVGVTLLRDAYEFGGATFHRASPITTSVPRSARRWPSSSMATVLPTPGAAPR